MFFTLIGVCILCRLCLIFLFPLFFHYMLCSVSHCGSLQCSIAFSFFISEHTSSSSQLRCKTANIIVGITTALVISLCLVTLYWFNLQWKEIPLKRNCFKLMECKNYFLHFVFKHAYITLILLAHLKLCSAPVYISEGISRLIFLAVANTKTRLKFWTPELVGVRTRLRWRVVHTVKKSWQELCDVWSVGT